MAVTCGQRAGQKAKRINSFSRVGARRAVPVILIEAKIKNQKLATDYSMMRVLLTGPPQCGKTTVVQKVVARWPGQAAGFYTREVRRAGRRLGFEIVTLAGEAALLSHVDFPGPYRVGKYGVNLENFHRLALPALEAGPGVDLIVVDEVGKMECLSPRFVAAMERLWAAPVPLLVTVAEKGGGLIAALKAKPDKTLITITPANRDELPADILKLLGGEIQRPGADP
jgi:nucleoside-triphosphatase